MLKTRIKKIRNLKPVHILSVSFLLYIFYVGFVGLPGIFTLLAETLTYQTGPAHFIKTVDEQYETMLTTEKDMPLLQNKAAYINLNGFLAKAMDQSMLHERVKLTNGHLTKLYPEPKDPERILAAAENVIRFDGMQQEKGGSLLFVVTPSQVSKYEDHLPTGYRDTTNDAADRFLALLDQAGVAYLDLREEMHREGMSVTDAFFKTDHHWTPQTSFWAYGKIAETLAQMEPAMALDPGYFQRDNFDFLTYEDCFLGSAGRRTGLYYAGVDDFTVIQPKFSTDLELTIPSRKFQRQGSYGEVCFNPNACPDFLNPDYFQNNAYAMYGWGDYDVMNWRNPTAPVDQRLLMIGASFGNIPFSFLSLCFTQCDELDMREYTDDFQAYYKNYDPHKVVMLSDVENLLGINTSYPFFPEAVSE